MADRPAEWWGSRWVRSYYRNDMADATCILGQYRAALLKTTARSALPIATGMKIVHSQVGIFLKIN